MNGEQFAALVVALANQYQQHKQAKPELELLALAYQAGGVLDVPDLPAWCAAHGYEPRTVRRRLRLAARAGLHYDGRRFYAGPSSPQTTNTDASSFPQPHAGAGAGAAAPANADADAAAAAGAHNAPAGGSCSLFSLFLSLDRLDARHERAAALECPPQGQEGEWEANALWLLQQVEAPIDDTLLANATVAVYSTSKKYTWELVRRACVKAISQGKRGGWEGWAHYIRQDPCEYLTRKTFARIVYELPGFAAESFRILEEQEQQLGTWTRAQIATDVRAWQKGKR